MAYGGEWPTVLRDLWALPRHKGEASLVKSPFFATQYLVQANLGGYATAVGRYLGDLSCLAMHAIQK
jgi:hypothetical protein